LLPSVKKIRLILTGLILLGGILPLFHYWYYIGRIPGVTPVEARQLLATADASAVLIDVRSPQQFEEMHLDGAENWPYEEMMALRTPDEIAEHFKGKTLLMVCDGGVLSAGATQKLRNQFGADAFNVRGGIQAWIASADKSGGVEVLFRSGTGETLPSPFKESSWYEQLALVGAVLIIKPLYTLITLILIVVLWRLKSPDVFALRWGLIFFFIGEGFCALNIIFFNHSFDLFEFFHMYGMVLSFAFVTYAILEALDLRILGYSDPKKRCAALGLCKQCIKYGEAPCGLKRTFYFLIPAFIVLSFIPLLTSTNAISYNTEVFGIFQNYSHPIIYQFFEFRYSPVYAIILFVASFFVLLLEKSHVIAVSKVLFAAGLGPLGFGFLRLVFFGVYQDNLVWFNFWEELTELVYVVGAGFVLLIFQRGVFQVKEGHISTTDVEGTT
jgi:rhodanese-related sulfurtransferase